jgi:uncharacterized membrane protein
MTDLEALTQRRAREFGRRDPFWPAQLTVAAAIVLSLDLPSSLTIQNVWLIPAIEGVLLVALVATTPRVHKQRPERRRVALVLIGLVSASNLVNLTLLVHHLLHPPHAKVPLSGRDLILAGVEIWITNVLLFTVWYWELDRGGPLARRLEVLCAPDFLFPQMTDPKLGGIDWRAGYVDYFYTSFTNASAFSPTDTMPLTPIAKMLMLVQSLTSLVTIGMVLARAVNVLTG